MIFEAVRKSRARGDPSGLLRRLAASRALVSIVVLAAAATACPGCGGDDREEAATAEERAAPAGLWKRARVASNDPGLTPEDREAVRRLESLGYVTGSVEPTTDRVVTVNLADRTDPGVNFLTSGHAPEALLIDMDGRVLHRWHASFASIWPDSKRTDPGYWRRAWLYPDGHVLAIFEGQGLVKLDRRSQVVWSSDLRAHHDLEVVANGDIYVLTREVNQITEINHGRPFMEDFVTILDAEGREKSKVSLLKSLVDSPFRDLFDPDQTAFEDLLHTNSLEVLNGKIADRVPQFSAGRILVSMLVPSLVAVIDLEAEQVVWAYQSDFRLQHDPKILDNGNMLVFDNRGLGALSRILEIDPESLERRWIYAGSRSEPFFTATCGTAQRLDNGNTLVTESDNGRAFEVDPDGSMVWEYHNPYRAGSDGEFVAALFEVLRLPDDFPLDWVEGGATP